MPAANENPSRRPTTSTTLLSFIVGEWAHGTTSSHPPGESWNTPDAAPPRCLTRRGVQRRRVRLCDHAAGRLARGAEDVSRPDGGNAQVPLLCHLLRAAIPGLVAALPVLPRVRPRRHDGHRPGRLSVVRRAVLRVPAEV